MQRLYAQFNTIIIHPLLTFTVCLMLGIWYAAGTSSVSIILALLICCSAYYILTAPPKHAILRIFICLIGYGTGYYLAWHQRGAHTQRAFILSSNSYDTVARVLSIQITDKEKYPYTVQLQLSKLKQPKRGSTWQEHSGIIAVYCHSMPFVEPDDMVYLEDVTFGKHSPTTDFNRYLIKSGIDGTVFCHHLTYTLLHRPNYSYARTISHIRNDVFDRVRAKMTQESAAFYSSLFLGNTQKNKLYLKEMRADFGMWGLSHFLARSGLHLVLFMYIWHMLLGYIPIRLRYKYLLMLTLNTVYLLFSWSSLSFLRSFSSLCLYYGAHVFEQQPSTLHIITLITCACLIINPMQLFFLDFQLSFGLTFALAWIYQTYSWQRLQVTANS